jgi:hypothetical protein
MNLSIVVSNVNLINNSLQQWVDISTVKHVCIERKNSTFKEVDEEHLYIINSWTSNVLDVGKIILKMNYENLLTLTMYFVIPDIVMTLKKW